MADADGITDVVDLSGNGKGVALNVYPYFGTPVVYANLAAFPAIGLIRNTYVAEDTERQYRWDPITLAYVEISPTDTSVINTIFVNDRASFAALNHITFPKVFFDGSLWSFNSANLSAFVTADTKQGIYLAPASAPTGTSGAYVRSFTGPVNPMWFQIVEGDAAGANGAANSVAWTAMWTTLGLLAKNIFSTQQSLLPIQFPLGYFEFANTIEINQGSVILEGVGSGSATHRGTELKFPAGATGILVQAHNTAGAGGAAVANHPGGTGSIIRGLTITGGFTTTEGEFHGIHLRGRANLEDCFIRNFEGDGIYSNATSGGATEGNTNNTFIKKVTVNGCRNGLYVDGADVNVWSILNLDCSSNRQWGIWDSGFLGNQYFACHVAGNGYVSGAETIGSVSEGGQRYTVIVGQEVGASTNAPSGTATDNTWWKHFGAGGASAAVPAWLSGTTYRVAGAIRTDNNSAKHVFVGCYREPGQGHAQMVRPTLIIGGVLASSSISGAGVIDVESGGTLVAYSGIRAAFGTGYSQIGESLVSTTMLLMNDSVVAPNSWRLKFSGNDVRLDYANNNPTFWVTGPSTTNQFGTGANVANAFAPVRLMIGDFAGSLANARRIQMEATVPPTANAHAAGEVCFKRNPALGGIAASVCVTAGTPGTWHPVGIVGGVQAAAQANSVAGDVATLVADFNSLLAKLRTANLLAP